MELSTYRAILLLTRKTTSRLLHEAEYFSPRDSVKTGVEWNAVYNLGKLYSAFTGMFLSASSNSLPIIVQHVEWTPGTTCQRRGEGSGDCCWQGAQQSNKGNTEYESYPLVFPNWYARLWDFTFCYQLRHPETWSHLIHPAIELCST